MAYGYKSFDADKVYKVEYERHFDDDDEDSYYTYDVAGFDANDFELFREYDLTSEELENYLGSYISQEIIKDNEDEGVLDCLINTMPNDINDVNEVNDIAKKIFRVTEYIPAERGYLLTDGSFLYFGPHVDHMSISMIDGMTIAQFISLGNIRMGTDGFQLANPPTIEQKRQLYKFIASVDDIYVDIADKPKRSSQVYAYPLDNAHFHNVDPRYVLNVINRFFNEGIRMRESKQYKNKTLIEKRGLQSKILYGYIKKYGTPWWKDVDIHLVTDDDIVYHSEGHFTRDLELKLKRQFKAFDFIVGDNYYLLVKPNKDKSKSYEDKLLQRDRNHNNTIDGAREYRWINKDAEDMIFKNPYFRDWDEESQKRALSNVKNKKRYFENKQVKHNSFKLTESDLEKIIFESIIDVINETKDRSEYWKTRWAKQKEDGTVPDRTAYWKERSKKQKKTKNNFPKKTKSIRYYDSDEYDDAMDMMTDNDWGEYFGDHD